MTVVVEPVALAPGVGAWFTGRAAGNLSHRRPHLPAQLARDRGRVRADAGVGPLHLMGQVHGSDVGSVVAATVEGAEVRGVDALVTAEPERALAVQVADCIPLLLASSEGPVAAVHAGRRGLVAGVVEAALGALARLGAPAPTLRAALGPAIGGCCYEVPADMRAAVASRHPAAAATTSWGTPSLDLPAAVETILTDAGATVVEDAGAGDLGCTRCDGDGRWFSHRADPSSGRQAGIVVRRAP